MFKISWMDRVRNLDVLARMPKGIEVMLTLEKRKLEQMRTRSSKNIVAKEFVTMVRQGTDNCQRSKRTRYLKKKKYTGILHE